MVAKCSMHLIIKRLLNETINGSACVQDFSANWFAISQRRTTALQ